MDKKTRFLFISSLVLVLILVLLNRGILPDLSPRSILQSHLKILERVIDLIKNDYFKEPDPQKTMEGAFRGMVDSLDVLSAYLDEESTRNFRQRMERRPKETGLILFKKPYSYPYVIGIVEGSPAEKAGINFGEIITSLDGRSTLSMSMLEANLRLKSGEKENLTLRVLKEEKPQELTLPKKVLFEDLYSFENSKGTSGILSIHRLYSPLVSQIKQNIVPLLKGEKKPLILDFRNCYEGELEEACKFLNIFLRAKTIGYLERKGVRAESFSCEEKAELENLPLLLWINQATIGPSEAVAVVIKHFKRGKLIGLPTLGLVAKQDIFFLPDGSSLVLTSGIFCLEEGEKIWGKGIEPDLKIDWTNQSKDSFLEKTKSLLSESS